MAKNAKSQSSHVNQSKDVSKNSVKSASEKKVKPNNHKTVRKTCDAVKPRAGFVRRVLGFTFNVAYYVCLALFAASTVAILMNCNDGGKQIRGSKPLCADLTKLAEFKSPSPQFLANARSTYGVVLNGYDRQLQPYYMPVVQQVKTHWRKFAKTDVGAIIERTAYQAHAWITEKVLLLTRKVQIKMREIEVWYKKDGHKTIGRYVDGFKIGMNMVFEFVKDVVTHVFQAVSYVVLRGKKFVVAFMDGGLQSAMKTLG